MSTAARLPARCPVGTKYVLEGRGQFVHRYVEFPNGRKVQLEMREAQTCTCAAISIVPGMNAEHAGSKPRKGTNVTTCKCAMPKRCRISRYSAGIF